MTDHDDSTPRTPQHVPARQPFLRTDPTPHHVTKTSAPFTVGAVTFPYVDDSHGNRVEMTPAREALFRKVLKQFPALFGCYTTAEIVIGAEKLFEQDTPDGER